MNKLNVKNKLIKFLFTAVLLATMLSCASIKVSTGSNNLPTNKGYLQLTDTNKVGQSVPPTYLEPKDGKHNHLTDGAAPGANDDKNGKVPDTKDNQIDADTSPSTAKNEKIASPTSIKPLPTILPAEVNNTASTNDHNYYFSVLFKTKLLSETKGQYSLLISPIDSREYNNKKPNLSYFKAESNEFKIETHYQKSPDAENPTITSKKSSILNEVEITETFKLDPSKQYNDPVKLSIYDAANTDLSIYEKSFEVSLGEDQSWIAGLFDKLLNLVKDQGELFATAMAGSLIAVGKNKITGLFGWKRKKEEEVVEVVEEVVEAKDNKSPDNKA